MVAGRKPDGEIQAEVEQLLQNLGLQVHVSEIVIPFVRSTFARLNLSIAPNTTLPEARRLQTNLVAELKGAGLKSEIEGSRGVDLWALSHRTAEKRNRIKAIVSTKDFCIAQSQIGRYQVLAHVEDDPSFSSGDVIYHCDKRGSHTGWLVKVAELSLALGKPSKDIHDSWYHFLENGVATLPPSLPPSYTINLRWWWRC